MRSRRSFFNFTVLRKDITRFFPVWGLFCVFLGLVWLSLHMSGARYIGRELMGFFTLASPWIAAYALICAVTLFGDLFQSRLCNALHTMPLRREGWFFTHAAAGALFFLVPYGLFCFMTVPLGVRWGFGGIEFLLGTMEYVLFFGMAILCVMLSGNRVGTVLLFFPVIVVMFFFLALMQDTGYMARVAFFMDRALRRIGLSGRSIVPMVMGFGCTVPAVMATRTLPSERDRKLTILLTPFMSCTAKLPIYGFFVHVFFPGKEVFRCAGKGVVHSVRCRDTA